MRVLHVIASMDPKGGGPSQSVRHIARQLVEWGHDAEVVSADAPVPGGESESKLKTHDLGPGRFGYAWTPGLVPWLVANQQRFDAVICHGLWLFPSYAVRRACRKGRSGKSTPYFIFPHGMLDPWFQRLDLRPWKSIRNWLYWKAIEHRVVRDAAAVCFTCEEERMLARLPFRPYQAIERVVNYGTAAPPAFRAEMAAAFRARCPELGDRPYLLFLGRIHPKKGVDLLLGAYAEIGEGRSEIGDRKQVPALVIAGPGLDSAYGRQMLALATANRSLPTAGCQLPTSPCQPPQVFFPGMLEGDAKWGAFYECEAFVLPSHQENFGIAVVEAMACGKPVLLSDRVNIWREIEADGAALVEPDTGEGTRHLLSRWLATPSDQRQAMERAALQSFGARFTIEQSVRSLLEVIEQGRSGYGERT